MKVEWSDTWCTGIAHVDEQHKGIIELLNKLYLDLEQRKDYKTLHSAVNQLADYAKVHFISEENYMDIKAYSGRYAHKVIHEEFQKKVILFTARILEGETNFAQEVADFILSWLLNHIMVEDIKLKEL